MRTVYLDLLFLCNFCCDYILIGITGILGKCKPKLLRAALGAVFGGIYSCIMFFVQIPLWQLILVHFLALFIMCAIVFYGGELIICLKHCALMLTVGFALGGGITALSFMFGNNTTFRMNNGIYYVEISLPLILMSAGATYLVIRVGLRCLMRIQAGMSPKAVIAVHLQGKTIKKSALIDTGCNLKDVVTGKIVIICDRQCAYKLCRGEIADKYPDRYRVLPLSTVSGEGSITAVRPDYIEVFFSNQKTQIKDVLMAVSGTRLKGGYSFIIPPELIAGLKASKEIKI